MFVEKDFDWAVEITSKAKRIDCSNAGFLSIDEGLCVQIMHNGSFDDEPAMPTALFADSDRKFVGDVILSSDGDICHEILEGLL